MIELVLPADAGLSIRQEAARLQLHGSSNSPGACSMRHARRLGFVSNSQTTIPFPDPSSSRSGAQGTDVRQPPGRESGNRCWR